MPSAKCQLLEMLLETILFNAELMRRQKYVLTYSRVMCGNINILHQIWFRAQTITIMKLICKASFKNYTAISRFTNPIHVAESK